VEELDRFCCLEKGADKEGASKFSGNNEDAGGIESQEEELGLSVSFNYYPNYLNHYDHYCHII